MKTIKSIAFILPLFILSISATTALGGGADYGISNGDESQNLRKRNEIVDESSNSRNHRGLEFLKIFGGLSLDHFGIGFSKEKEVEELDAMMSHSGSNDIIDLDDYYEVEIGGVSGGASGLLGLFLLLIILSLLT